LLVTVLNASKCDTLYYRIIKYKVDALVLVIFSLLNRSIKVT